MAKTHSSTAYESKNIQHGRILSIEIFACKCSSPMATAKDEINTRIVTGQAKASERCDKCNKNVQT